MAVRTLPRDPPGGGGGPKTKIKNLCKHFQVIGELGKETASIYHYRRATEPWDDFPGFVPAGW